MTGKKPKAGRTAGKEAAARAPRNRGYHHGDLPRALRDEAVRMIGRSGVDALTLRAVGDRLGVSRTALYRHYANKDALLGAVADDGFRRLRADLVAAWEGGGRGRAGFDAMGLAYVSFAQAHPAHYRVMFGEGARHTPSEDPESRAGAFGALVDAIAAQQAEGLLRPDDAVAMASYIWAVVHGLAMLALDGALKDPAGFEPLTRFALERLHTGIDAAPNR